MGEKKDLEEKIKETGIKRILIADDTTENLEAARQYFSSLEKYGVKTDYAPGERQAVEMIENAYHENEKYSIVISDMQMEDEKSGLEVVKQGFKHLAYGIIATGINYSNSADHSHAPETYIEPNIGKIKGKKDNPVVWGSVFEQTTEFLTQDIGKKIFEAFKTYVDVSQENQMQHDEFADLMMRPYFWNRFNHFIK